jgi:sec-independent protein translocase protein TatA
LPCEASCARVGIAWLKQGAWRRFMGEFSIFHWLVVLAIVLLLFGGRKIPEVMRGLGEGIRNFKEGMSGASHPTAPPPQQAAPPAAEKPAEEKKA